MDSYITLDSVVLDVLSDQEKYTTHEYLRLLGFAHRGLKTLTYDILGNVKIDLIEFDAALRIDLPTDFVDYTFIGLVGSDGRLKPLGNRRNIPLVGTTNVQTPKANQEAYVYNAVFGNGGGQNENGYYSPTIDSEESQMVFTSMAAGKWIYLEYISNGSADTSEAKVHPYAEEALIAYVHWKDIQRKRYIPKTEKDDARAEFYNEKRLARSRLASFTKEEAVQQTRKGFKQSPKI
jgi:hypothetical protein